MEETFVEEDISMEDPDGEVEKCEAGEEVITDIADRLRQSLASSGEDILQALKVMRANLEGIKTPAALVSALVTFGKGIVIQNYCVYYF